MPKKASTHGASKSKTARSKPAKAKSKDNAAPRKEASKRTAVATTQRGSPRRSRSRSLSPDDRPNPRFAYRDHSPGAESPVFDIPTLTGSESDGDSPGPTKNPTPSQDDPSQDAPTDDAESSEAKAASTSSPVKSLTLAEGKARAQAAQAASSKRADEGAAAAKKRAAPGSPTSEPSIAKGFKSLFDSSDEEEEEGLSLSPKISLMISMSGRSAITLLNCKALLHLLRRSILADTIHRMRAPQGPRGLNHGRTSRGAYERGLVQDEPLFVNDIEAARCVLLAPHRIPLKEFTSLRKKPKDRSQNTTTQSQAEGLFWRWVSLKNLTVQELKELREDRLLSYVLDQRDLGIQVAHLIAKRQLHSVMERLRQQSKSSAQDERGYGSVNPGTVHRKAAKKPRTTYAPAVADPKSQQPSAVNPEPSAAVLGRPAPHGSGARRSDQGGQEELSHVFEYEAPSQSYPSGPSTSGRDSVGSLLSDEVRQLRDRVYAIEIALGLGPGGQAASQAGKPGALVVLRQDLDTWSSASALKELRRGLDALSHEVHGRMPSFEPQGYSYHSAYGYSSYPSSSHSVPSYPSYDSRGYQPVYQSQASTPATPVVQRTQPRFGERIVIPLKTPHVERRVNGICRAMCSQDCTGSDEAVLQLVALYRANHL
ncbi:Hypothetical protein PHPALM_775 [Phytophthora palmivora]|uniref:ATP-binding cassette (ABC) Superfamily n=1 Tax=Phytophthora palmivora TaxID=4796 RepID=A0A2P4YU04_9STRA|nr:Hypothetical protein PHPALM_775 [Phytophthora palmivora]